jgi:hypothetical protein
MPGVVLRVRDAAACFIVLVSLTATALADVPKDADPITSTDEWWERQDVQVGVGIGFGLLVFGLAIRGRRRARRRAIELANRRTQFGMSAVNPMIAHHNVAAWERGAAIIPTAIRPEMSSSKPQSQPSPHAVASAPHGPSMVAPHAPSIAAPHPPSFATQAHSPSIAAQHAPGFAAQHVAPSFAAQAHSPSIAAQHAPGFAAQHVAPSFAAQHVAQSFAAEPRAAPYRGYSPADLVAFGMAPSARPVMVPAPSHPASQPAVMPLAPIASPLHPAAPMPPMVASHPAPMVMPIVSAPTVMPLVSPPIASHPAPVSSPILASHPAPAVMPLVPAVASKPGLRRCHAPWAAPVKGVAHPQQPTSFAPPQPMSFAPAQPMSFAAPSQPTSHAPQTPPPVVSSSSQAGLARTWHPFAQMTSAEPEVALMQPASFAPQAVSERRARLADGTPHPPIADPQPFAGLPPSYLPPAQFVTSDPEATTHFAPTELPKSFVLESSMTNEMTAFVEPQFARGSQPAQHLDPVRLTLQPATPEAETRIASPAQPHQALRR